MDDRSSRVAGSFFIPVAVLLIAGLFVGASQAAEISCLTDDCHRSIRAGAFLHGPIAGGMCPICHATGAAPVKPLPSGHPAVRIESGKFVCMACHEEIRVLLQQPHVHTPVAEGNCIDCHNPHLGGNTLFLNYPPAFINGRQRIAGSCNACHEPGSPDWYDEFHAGEAILDCTVCHNAHASGEKFLLTRYVRNIYLQGVLAEADEHRQGGDLNAAAQAYLKAIRITPGDENVRLALGQIFLDQERWKDAGKEFDSILARAPGNVSALLGAARVEFQLSGPYAGLKHLRRAIESDPRRADLHHEVGLAYRRLGQIQEALGAFAQAVALDPRRAETYLQLSQIHEAFGHSNEAQKSMEMYRSLLRKE